jgi:hypothetical protein
MTAQPDLFTPLTSPAAHGATEPEQANLRAHLLSHGWQTRRDLCTALNWDERKLRAVAESLGADIVRCQLGYKLTDTITREEFSAAIQGCDAAESQAKKQLAWALGVRRRLHAIIG